MPIRRKVDSGHELFLPRSAEQTFMDASLRRCRGLTNLTAPQQTSLDLLERAALRLGYESLDEDERNGAHAGEDEEGARHADRSRKGQEAQRYGGVYPPGGGRGDRHPEWADRRGEKLRHQNVGQRSQAAGERDDEDAQEDDDHHAAELAAGIQGQRE